MTKAKISSNVIDNKSKRKPRPYSSLGRHNVIFHTTFFPLIIENPLIREKMNLKSQTHRKMVRDVNIKTC